MYAPSKGFRSFPEFGVKREVPRELGYSACTLGNHTNETEETRWYTGKNFSDGTPIYLGDGLHSEREWAKIDHALRVLSGNPAAIAKHDCNLRIKEENRLSRNEQKKAKHRVQTVVALRAKRMLKLDSSLDPMRAIAMAEEQYAAQLATLEAHGKPSYQYAKPAFDAHNLRYQLQDNAKSRFHGEWKRQDNGVMLRVR